MNATMNANEIARLQAYLRGLFGNSAITIRPPKKPTAPIEVYIGEEFIAVVHRDEDDGEVSYALNMAILEDDLPKAGAL